MCANIRGMVIHFDFDNNQFEYFSILIINVDNLCYSKIFSHKERGKYMNGDFNAVLRYYIKKTLIGGLTLLYTC